MSPLLVILSLLCLFVPSGAWAEGPPALRKVVVLDVQTVPLPGQVAEDGQGNRRQATAPIAVDITAERWPGRALDPVLHVGKNSFFEYRFPAPGVMRFLVADATLLDVPNQIIYLQYGDDVGSRVEIVP